MIQFALGALGLPEDRAAAYLEKFRGAPIPAAPAKSAFPYMELRELDVNGARLTGQDLHQARIRERFGVTIVSIRRESGEVIANPPANSILQAGDKLRVFGLPQQIADLAAEMQAGK